jgi:putative ATP-binding cassette transporter
MESTAVILDVLNRVGLQKLAADIDVVDDWTKRLSLGEQQRLAFARLLLIRPALVFLDEATSALDEKSEAALYRMLRDAPWRPAIVSVGHRSTLVQFHDRILDLTAHSPIPSGDETIELTHFPPTSSQNGNTLFPASGHEPDIKTLTADERRFTQMNFGGSKHRGLVEPRSGETL